jgi:hypothetical protein
MDRLLKIVLRLWFAFVSLFSFMAGWVLFAHSGKPADANTAISQVPPPQVSSITLPQLAPVLSLQQLQQNPQLASSAQIPTTINLKVSPGLPVLRTRKS